MHFLFVPNTNLVTVHEFRFHGEWQALISGKCHPQSKDKPRCREIPPRPADRLGQNLRRLDRLANLGLFAASVAHEIKNGMVAINTFVDLLLQKERGRGTWPRSSGASCGASTRW